MLMSEWCRRSRSKNNGQSFSQGRRTRRHSALVFQPITKELTRSYSQLQKAQRKESMIPGPLPQKYRILIASTAILTLAVIVGSPASTGEQQKVIHELRIYEIFDANKKAFHDRFRDHAMRIMAKIRL